MSIFHKLQTAAQKARQGKFFSHLHDKIMLKAIKNKNVFSEYKKAQAYYNLKKKYSKLLIDDCQPKEIVPEKKLRIWTCWFQGEENAPSLVKSCIDSMRKTFGIENVTVITDANFSDFVTLPDFILEKYRRKIISSAHFSDILRIELLYKYGGLWLDSTVFCTCKNIPEYFFDSDLFVYQSINLTRNDTSPNAMSSWLIKSNEKNPIICKTRELLFAYWYKEKEIINYYLLHIFFTFATEIYSDLWKKVPVFSNIPPHILQFEFFEKYDEKRFSEICNYSDFHKLNWKVQKKHEIEFFTNYDYILSFV